MGCETTVATSPAKKSERRDISARVSAGRVMTTVGAALLAGVLLWSAPHLAGADWAGIADALTSVTARQIAILLLVWMAGLVAHSFVLTGALPGLTRSRALTLSLTGSAVSNALPFGGALGVATNLRMARAWKINDADFGVFTVVSNVWDVLAKLMLPLIASLLVFSLGVSVPGMQSLVVTTSVCLGVVAGLSLAGLVSDRMSRSVTATIRLVAKNCLPRRWSAGTERMAQIVLVARDSMREVVRSKWGQMTLGMVSYLALQLLLLWMTLHLVGVSLGLPAVLTAFAVERLSTLAVVTPGGVGIGEAATIAALVAFGGEPVAVAAGVLLYRVFTHVVEIPVGGLWLGGWLLTQRQSAAA